MSAAYPVGSRVILTGLVGGKEYNGKTGVVQSPLNANGRQQVSLMDISKVLSIKVSNLLWEPRSVSTLSLAEMKIILKAKKLDGEIAGLDKDELQKLVMESVDSEEDVASILAHERESSLKQSYANNQRDMDMSNNAMKHQMQNVSPDQLRQQAKMMKSMDPAMIRRMNPAMANFTDAQILMAANEMEAMANNPDQFKGLVDQMSNMSESELNEIRRMQTQQKGGAAPPTANPGAPSLTKDHIEKGAESISKMSPDHMRQQAERLKAMDKDTLRKMNPAWSQMSDAQIDMSIKQMEMMANNPEMMKSMVDQVKGMKPEDIEKIQKYSTGGNSGMPSMGAGMPQDPMDILKNTDPSQIKEMLNVVKENPGMVKEMMKSANVDPDMADNLTDEQIQKTIDMFNNLDEKKIGMLMSLLGWYQGISQRVGKKGFLLGLIFIIVCIYGIYSYIVKGEAIAPDTGSVPMVDEQDTEF